MDQNFFEILGMANIERIHSQMWLYFFQPDFLESEQKSCILNNLFGTEGKYENFKCYTEYKSIDVLIIADDNKVFAIENKVKIGQHDNQLKNYYNILKDDFKENPCCVYLSLIGENPFAQNWLPRSYKSLLNTLQMVYFEKPKNLQEQIFNEYVESLEKLTEVFDEFSNHHEEFYRVFMDGNKTKDAKRELIKTESYYKNNNQKYIALNQLETIFQKHFLLRIAEGMNANLCSEELPKAHISESQGTALLNIHIQENHDNKEFLFGIQFQDNTVKITYSKKDCQNSSKKELGEKEFEEFKKFGLENRLRFNPPRTKAYMSISKKIDNRQMWKKDFDIILNIYKEAYEDCVKLIKEIDKRFKNLPGKEHIDTEEAALINSDY